MSHFEYVDVFVHITSNPSIKLIIGFKNAPIIFRTSCVFREVLISAVLSNGMTSMEGGTGQTRLFRLSKHTRIHAYKRIIIIGYLNHPLTSYHWYSKSQYRNSKTSRICGCVKDTK